MSDGRVISEHDLIASLRSTDPRVDIVIAAFVAQRLGWTLDDPVDQVTPLVLDSMVRGVYVVGAKKLLDRLDTLVVRDWVSRNGEDAMLEVRARLDDRVRRLTYELEQARAALRARDDGTNPAAEPPERARPLNRPTRRASGLPVHTDLKETSGECRFVVESTPAR